MPQEPYLSTVTKADKSEWLEKIFNSFFNRERQALVLTSFKGLIFIVRSITVQPKVLSLNG